jgi:putative transposase
MRHSLHTEHEILFLLFEANAGVPIAEICSTAGISLRTFYRWRKRYGGLTTEALRHLKELEIENRRLRSLVTKLSDRAHFAPPAGHAARGEQPSRQEFGAGSGTATSPAVPSRGASLGRFASVRCVR